LVIWTECAIIFTDTCFVLCCQVPWTDGTCSVAWWGWKSPLRTRCATVLHLEVSCNTLPVRVCANSRSRERHTPIPWMIFHNNIRRWTVFAIVCQRRDVVIFLIAFIDWNIWNRVSRDGAVTSITQNHRVLGGYKLMTCIDIKINSQLSLNLACVSPFDTKYTT